MPQNIDASDQEWLELYSAAIEFKNAKCWDWMDESDMFGVINPKNGETGYCCIMGSTGEHYAIAAYLGTAGLEGLLNMLSGDAKIESIDTLFIRNCLQCSFENRDYLAPEDLKTIKALGLKFRGRNEWPFFRHFEPGLFPWFLNSDQVCFLTHVLRQTLQVALRCKENPAILKHKNPLNFLIRSPNPDKNGQLSWSDKYHTAKPVKEKYVSFVFTNEILARKIKSLKPKKDLVLEVETFYIPIPVQEQGRPFYPKTCMFINHADSMIVCHEMFQNLEKEGYKCIKMLSELILKTGLKPLLLLVARDETYHLFSEVCVQLGIKLKMTDRLVFLEQARQSIVEYFQNS